MTRTELYAKFEEKTGKKVPSTFSTRGKVFEYLHWLENEVIQQEPQEIGDNRAQNGKK